MFNRSIRFLVASVFMVLMGTAFANDMKSMDVAQCSCGQGQVDCKCEPKT